MLIKKMELYNFRQFKGRQTIDFSTDENQNITLILGDNTSGKTTILQAIRWCLYEKAKFKRSDILLNELVVNELMDGNNTKRRETSVTLHMRYDDFEYTLTRTLGYYIHGEKVNPESRTTLEMSYKSDDGQTLLIEDYLIKDKIKEILPEELSTYFLYDTERFGNVTAKDDVNDAVKGLLGLTVLDNIRRHIGRETRAETVLGQFKSSIVENEGAKANAALTKAHAAENAIETYRERKVNAIEEQKKYEKDKRENQQKLKELESSAQMQRQKEKLEQLKRAEERKLVEKEKNFFKKFQEKQYLYFAQPLYKKALEKLVDADIADKGIRDMNANSITQIIERGYCLCGTKIMHGDQAHTNLMQEKEYLPPQSLGVMINQYQEIAKRDLESTNNYFAMINESYSDILLLKKTIGNYSDEIKAYEESLKNQEDSGKYQVKLNEAEMKIKQLERRLGEIDRSIEVEESTMKENEAVYQSLISTSEKNNEIRKYMAYAQRLHDWADERYKDRESTIRGDLEEKVNLYFSQIYHGNRIVEIDEKYRVDLKATAGSREVSTDESQGLETVKNFSFIAGLVNLAKIKLQDDANEEIDSEAATFPLILDAPFSNADGTHVKNISKVLPNVAEQLIMIVMAKDWNYAEEQLKHRVGKRYRLEKLSEVHTNIVEVN